MKKNKITLAGILATSFVAIIAIATGTFAWFAERSLEDPVQVDITGSASPYFYASGTGRLPGTLSEDDPGDPFIIEEPVHLYNLAWLQYLGTYNKDENSDGVVDEQFCFKLSDNIPATGLNMSGYTLPPIGTEANPFLGYFDGNNKKIINLTTSNKESDFGTRKPANITYTAPEIVGFFGVVGAIEGDNTPTYDSSVNEFINTTLEGFTVKSTTTKTLVGLAAGYVNGTMSGIKLGGSTTINVNERACSAIGGQFTKLSNYGIVGYSTKRAGSGDYSQTISEYHTQGGSGGTGNDWGGSINIRALNNRIYNLLNTSSNVATDDPASSHPTALGNSNKTNIETGKTIMSYDKWHRYYTDSYNTVTVAAYSSTVHQSSTIPATSNYDTNPESVDNLTYRLENADTKKNYDQNLSGKTTINLPGTMLPLLVDEKSTGYATLAKNTGYIVGGSKSLSASSYYSQSTTLNVGVHPLVRIGNSISSSGDSSATFVNSQLEIITNSSTTYSASNFGRIYDSYNSSNSSVASAMSTAIADRTVDGSKLKKYAASRDKLKDIMSGKNSVNGLHFLGTNISTSAYSTIETAYIDGSTYSDYKMPNGSIDFNLKKNGYINFFAGSYQGGHGVATDSFFSLNVITRSGSNLSTIKEIKAIYANTNATTKKTCPHVYQYTDNSYSTGSNSVEYTVGSLEFDMQFLWNTPPVNHALYYFEIPANNGEYAMGCHSGKTNGTYLMYLDIGATGEIDDQVDAYSIKTESGAFEHPAGVDFNVTGYNANGGSSFGVEIDSGHQGTIAFVVASNGSSVAITTGSSFAKYSFQSATFGVSYTVSGDTNIEELGDPPGGASIVYHIRVAPSGGGVHSVFIYDEIDEEDNVTTTYKLDGSFVSLDTLQAQLTVLDNELIDTIKGLDAAIVLTRLYGDNTFEAELPDMPWTSATTYDITLDETGLSIGVEITGEITVTINGITVEDGDTYPE